MAGDRIHAERSKVTSRESTPLPRSRASFAGLQRQEASASDEPPPNGDFSRISIHPPAGPPPVPPPGTRAVTVDGRSGFLPGIADASTFEGRRLLGHERAHAEQQARGPGMSPELDDDSRAALEAEADRAGDAFARGMPFTVFGRAPPGVPLYDGKPAKRIIVKITLYDADNQVLLEFDKGEPLLLKATYNGHPAPGTYHLPAGKGHGGDVIKTGTASAKGYIVEFTTPKDVAPAWTAAHDFIVVPSMGSGTGTGTGPGPGPGTRPGTGPGATPTQAPATQPTQGQGPQGGVAGSTPSAPPPDVTGLSPEDLAAWRELSALLANAGGAPPTVSVDQLVRFYRVIRSMVDHPTFTAQGVDMVRFAQFLEENRERIDGLLQSGPRGTLTQDQLAKIIKDYGKFIAGEPLDPEDAMTAEKFDKEFEYDPGWQKLSKADKKLLLQFAQMSPEQTSKAKVDFDHVTVDMKLVMALKLSWGSWPAEIAQTAKEAFSDWVFITTLVLTVMVYVGLWLTPDPSMITKILAGGLTIYLWANFAWSDIVGLAVAFDTLIDDCAKAKTVPELQAAGDKFAKKVGSVGFDILMFIAMWRLGKRFGPKIRGAAAERGVSRAQAQLGEAEARPGSGVVPKAAAGAPDVVANAKAAAGPGATAKAVLDALRAQLPDDAKQGLDNLRAKAGDANTLKSVEARTAKGQDVSRYLADEGVTGDARTAAQEGVRAAKLRLARARLIESSVIKDPAMRAEARRAALRLVLDALADYGVLDEVSKSANSRPFKDLVAALGEALSRVNVRQWFPESSGYKILANVLVVQEVPGYKTLAEWKAAGNDTAGYYEADGKVWRARGVGGEIDTMAAKVGPDGKLSPEYVEQVKTGSGDSATEASAQTKKFLDGVRKLVAGDKSFRLYQKLPGERLGANLTDAFNWSGIDKLVSSTRGPEGKAGFDQSLGFDVDTLAALAKTLAQNLPPAGPQTIPPVVSGRPKDREPPPPAP